MAHCLLSNQFDSPPFCGDIIQEGKGHRARRNRDLWISFKVKGAQCAPYDCDTLPEKWVGVRIFDGGRGFAAISEFLFIR
jgi:hypothetical protein